MKSPRSSASDGCGSVVLDDSMLTLAYAPFLCFELFFACLFFLGLGFSVGVARALRIGSLRQSRNVS